MTTTTRPSTIDVLQRLYEGVEGQVLDARIAWAEALDVKPAAEVADLYVKLHWLAGRAQGLHLALNELRAAEAGY